MTATESQVEGQIVSGELKDISITTISMNPEAINVRSVRKESNGFEQLTHSIATKGLLNPIVVRPHPQFPGRYSIVDGLHRLTACQTLQWSTIPANVIHVDDADMLEHQIIANIQRRDNTPAENAEALFKIVNMDTNMKVKDLALRLSKTEGWVYQQFKLLRLPKEVQEKVDDGKIPLANAYSLVKVFDSKHAPEAMQKDFTDKSEYLNTTEFMAEVEGALKKLRAEVRAGAKITGSVAPTPVLRSKAQIVTEYERFNNWAIQEKAQGKTPSPKKMGYLKALEWALQLDPATLEAKASERESKKKAREEARKEKLAGTLEDSMSRAGE